MVDEKIDYILISWQILVVICKNLQVMCQTSQSRHIDNDIELCKWVLTLNSLGWETKYFTGYILALISEIIKKSLVSFQSLPKCHCWTVAKTLIATWTPHPHARPPPSSLDFSSSPTWRFGDMTIITSFTTATIIMILLRSTSCAEWCLSKGGGSCDQLFVSVRQVMISWWSLLREKKFWTAFFRMGRMSTLKIAKRCHCHHRHHHNHQWALNIW